MVAMQMAYEYVVEAGELQALPAHRELCALAAVNHHKRAPIVHHLACREVPERRCGRTAAEYVYFEFTHAIITYFGHSLLKTVAENFATIYVFI